MTEPANVYTTSPYFGAERPVDGATTYVKPQPAELDDNDDPDQT